MILDNATILGLIPAAKSGDKRAATMIIQSLDRLVHQIAGKQIRFHGDKHEDAVQEGRIGILDAIRTFDNSKMDKFLPHARNFIWARIINAAKVDAGIKTRNGRKLFTKLAKAEKKLRDSGQDEKDTKVLAQILEVDEEDIHAFKRALTPINDIDEHVNDLHNDRASAENELAGFEIAKKLKAEIREIIYFSSIFSTNEIAALENLMSEEEKELSKMANELGISRQRMLQIKQSAISKLAKKLQPKMEKMGCHSTMNF